MDMRARLWGHIDYYDDSVSILEVDFNIFYNARIIIDSITSKPMLIERSFVLLGDYYTPSRLHYSLSMINTNTDTSLVDKSSSPRFR
jgi:hypothetical protein